MRDFPGGPMVKNLPCNAEEAGLIPGQGTRIPHATPKDPHRQQRRLKILVVQPNKRNKYFKKERKKRIMWL